MAATKNYGANLLKLRLRLSIMKVGFDCFSLIAVMFTVSSGKGNNYITLIMKTSVQNNWLLVWLPANMSRRSDIV